MAKFKTKSVGLFTVLGDVKNNWNMLRSEEQMLICIRVEYISFETIVILPAM